MKRRALLLLLLLLCVSIPVGIADDDGTTFSRQRSLTSTFEYSGTASEVILRGEWDWELETSMVHENGIWSVEMEIDAGMYCYKLVVDSVWVMDPMNHQTTWCDGFENSLLRVANHSRPSLDVASVGLEAGNFTSVIEFSSSAAAHSPAWVEAELENGVGDLQTTWSEESWSLQISASGLEDGKYRIRVSASDESGASAEDILLPFWVEDEKFQWDDALIYMVMTDRFVNANTSNDPAPLEGAANGADWLGGDLEGVTSRLDEISALGINTIWLSPFNQGPTELEIAADGVHQVAGYHGYWPTEPRSLDSRLGTEEQLENLVIEAHALGIRIMADMVVNHVHDEHPYFTEHPDWFNDGCICGSSGCDWTERRLDCLFMTYMPDVDWRNRNASEQFIDDAIWWVERFDLDGLRIDAVKHVEDNAVNNMAARLSERFEQAGVELYLKGETAMGWSGDSIEANAEQYATINRYMGEGGLDGQADFVLYHAVVDNVLTSGDMGLIHLDHWTWQSTQQYVEGAVMVPYIGSHDVPRFISRADPDATGVWNQWENVPEETTNPLAFERWKLAMAWLLTIPGAPMLYAGDEYAMEGGADPDNRRMFDATGNLSEWVGELGMARASFEPLRRGTYVQLDAEEEIMAFARQTADEHVVVVLNRGVESIDLSAHDWLGEMDDILGNAQMNAGVVEMNGESAAIFVQRELGNQSTNGSQTGNGSENGNQSGNDNGTVSGNNSTEESPCPMMPCVSCSEGEEAVSSVDENGCTVCTCQTVEENSTSTSGDSTSSSSIFKDMRWVLLGVIILVVSAIFILGRKPPLEE
ncbi:MAG: alpha-amylase family glycosyl hydrolase [Candidatus Poseidoniaceae archaeon]|nr:alpha-amylase family glycosyl hydrolase [Candidatus Poseidoniaceae archaeon]